MTLNAPIGHSGANGEIGSEMRSDADRAALVEKLRALWPDRDLTATQIGDLVGLNKNQVLGLAHRNDFPERQPAVHRGPRRATLARVTVFAWEHHPQPGSRECRFPMWAHGDPPSHRYCCAKVRLGEAYCKTHQQRCLTQASPSAGTMRRAPEPITR